MRYIVLDIGGTTIKSAVIENNQMSCFSEISTHAQYGGKVVVDRVIRQIRQLGHCNAIGISTAGQVDSEKGRIIYANENLPGYSGTELGKIIFEIFRVPVVVENDVNAAALGEGSYGAAKGIKDYLCLTYGTGVGGAVIINGEVFRGITGSAGEFGSMIIHGDEVVRNTRISGCYENYASTKALISKVQKVFPHIINGRQLFENIEEPRVQKILEEWVEEIGHGLVSLIHIFNPECVVIGGGIMEQDYLIDKVRNCVMQRIMPSFRNVHICRADLKNKAGLWGMAYLIHKKYN